MLVFLFLYVMIVGLFKLILKILKWIVIFIFFLFIILSIMPYLFSINKKSSEIKPYQNSELFYFQNTKYHYRVFKTKQIKQKIALIHGFSASTFSFRYNSDFLSQNNCHVIAIDMPGFGFSDKSDSANYSDSSRINAIHGILKKQDSILNNSEKWILVGHSMGANASAKYATMYPNHLKALIWIDGAVINQKLSPLNKLVLYPPLLRWADVILEKYFLNHEKFAELLSSAYSSVPDSADVEGYLAPFRISGSGSAIFRMYAQTGNIIVNENSLNQFPKLVIWGKNDTWIPFTNIQKDIKGNVVLIDGAGHCPMETHSQEVNNIIINFITRLSH